MENLRIYVGTYKKYNEGSLYGAWLDLEDYSDFDELMDAMRTLHKDEESPEFMFQDYECSEVFTDLGMISESYISDEIYDVIAAIENSAYNEEIIEAYTYCTNIHGRDIDDLISEIEDCYLGEYESDIDFAQERLEEDIPDNFPSYISIDWESTARTFMYDFCSHRNHYFHIR